MVKSQMRRRTPMRGSWRCRGPRSPRPGSSALERVFAAHVWVAAIDAKHHINIRWDGISCIFALVVFLPHVRQRFPCEFENREVPQSLFALGIALGVDLVHE
eukprot:3819538-Rhodomonas_salina.2